MNPLFAFDDAQCQALAEAHGTPCFAYSGRVAEAQFRALRAVLPARVRLAFAVKANSHPALLRRFATLGASFDCASIGELEKVEALALPPGRTFFAGPGKREPELQKALALGVRIQAEGWEDLARIDERSVSKYLAIVIQQHVDGVLSEPAEQSRSADSQPK